MKLADRADICSDVIFKSGFSLSLLVAYALFLAYQYLQ